MSLVVDSTYQNMAASLVSPPRSVPNSVYPAGLDSAYSLGELDGLVTDLRFQHPAAIAKAQSMDISGLQLIRSPDNKSRLSHSAVANASPIMDMATRSPSSNTPNNGRSWPPSNGRGGMHRGKPRALFRDGECRDGSYSSPNSPSVRGRGCMPRGRGSYRGGRGLADPNRRGQGHYRRLWAEVTKVGRGQKLGEGDHTFSDSSVEDMLQLVRGLAPDASAVTAISQGLYYLDSGALAALLKELAKSGHGKRAMEVFDWLRNLDDTHELTCLCDVYTYTTMISQCGSHQQLRRALELVAEMRGRGVACNVHTYSALMNVCIKANELDLALDVYKQLLSDSCTPNLVTYNTLIDVYGKTGQWEEAVKILDALEHQGIEPEIRTYNTVIIACNMSGQAQEALKVYERMLTAGAQPTATTYTALISAYGKNGQLDRALQIFEDMIRRGCERNVITYSSLISACEKAGRWELALDLFNEMHREGCKPNVVTYNSLIAACAQGAQWEKAVELFDQMQSKGCKPDSVTYGGLVLAYEKGGQWRRALTAFDQMKTTNCRPDSVVYNTVVGVLWNTGVVWAQAKAVQVFQTACRQGHFRLTVHSSNDSSSVEFGMHAFTVGAAVISLMRWLSELRDRLPKDGPAMLRQQVCMTVNKGKPSREGAYPNIKAAIASLLQGCHSPFRLYDVACGCRLEGPASEVAQWLRSPDLERGVAPYCKADPLRGLNKDLLLTEDVEVERRCSEAFAAVKRFEESHKVAAQSMSAEYMAGRKECVRLAMTHVRTFGFKDEVLHDAVLLVDRTMSSGIGLPPAMLPLLVAACILIAARQGEQAEVLPGDAETERVLGVSLRAVEGMDKSVRQVLGADTSAISTLRCLKLYLERLGSDFQNAAELHRVAGDAFGLLYQGLADPALLKHMPSLTAAIMSASCCYAAGIVPRLPPQDPDCAAGDAFGLLYQGLADPALLKHKPSLTAAAMLASCRCAAGIVPFWPGTLESLTGYREQHAADFGSAMAAVGNLMTVVYSSGELLPHHSY